MNRYIYVDNSSTTRLNESVLYKMLPYLIDIRIECIYYV